MARIASAGTIFIPGKLNGLPSERTSRCTKPQQAAQQSRYINKTATSERTASLSNVPLIDSANASPAYVQSRQLVTESGGAHAPQTAATGRRGRRQKSR